MLRAARRCAVRSGARRTRSVWPGPRRDCCKPLSTSTTTATSSSSSSVAVGLGSAALNHADAAAAEGRFASLDSLLDHSPALPLRPSAHRSAVWVGGTYPTGSIISAANLYLGRIGLRVGYSTRKKVEGRIAELVRLARTKRRVAEAEAEAATGTAEGAQVGLPATDGATGAASGAGAGGSSADAKKELLHADDVGLVDDGSIDEGDALNMARNRALGRGAFFVVSRLRERGAYVIFDDPRDAEAFLTLDRNNDYGFTIHAVHGRPLLEDVASHEPSAMLRIYLKGVAESMYDDLFAMLRPHGRILSLEVDSSAGLVMVLFSSVASAVAAKNCVHNGVWSSTTSPLVVRYDRSRSGGHRFRALLSSPRLVPFLALGLVVLFASMLEPVRIVNVVQQLFHQSAQASPEETAAVDPDGSLAEHLRQRFSSPPQRVTLLVGPPGSGKSSLLRAVTSGRRMSARVDCRNMVAADEGRFVEELEDSIGFWPSFSIVNRLFSYIETMLPSKADLSVSTVTQMEAVLLTLSRALRTTAALFPSDSSRPYQYSMIVFDSIDVLTRSAADKVEKASDRDRLFLDALASWAYNTNLVQRTAHVVFVCDDAVTVDELAKYPALRGGFDVISVGDLSEDRVRNLLATGARRAGVVDPGAVRGAATSPQQEQQPQEQQQQQQVPAAPAVAPADASGPKNKENRKQKAEGSVLSLWRIVGLMRNAGAALSSSLIPSAVFGRPDATPGTSAASVIGGGDMDEAEGDLPGLAEAADVVGGRVSDVVSLVARLGPSRDLRTASAQMFHERRLDVLNRGFGVKLFSEAVEHDGAPANSTVHVTWTQPQLWGAIRMFSREYARKAGSDSEELPRRRHLTFLPPSVSYSRILVEVFEGDDRALRGLVAAGLLHVAVGSASAAGDHTADRPHQRDPDSDADLRMVSPGSPLVGLVFLELAKHPTFSAKMDKARRKVKHNKVRAEIQVIEEELVRLNEGATDAPHRRTLLQRELEKLSAEDEAIDLSVSSGGSAGGGSGSSGGGGGSGSGGSSSSGGGSGGNSAAAGGVGVGVVSSSGGGGA